MADQKTLHRSGPHRLGVLIMPHVKMAGLVGLAAAPILIAASLVPPGAILHVASLAAVGSAALVAFAAWWLGARRDGDTVTLWDIAGALVFVGCAAAMLSEPENLLQTFGLTPD
jgi:hypothetical protein